MTEHLVVYGSWRLRYEASPPLADHTLVLYSIAESAARDHSVVIDLRGRARPRYIHDPSGFHPAGEGAAESDLRNLGANSIPLALVTLTDDSLELTHLVARLETQVSHFLVSEGLGRMVPSARLVDALASELQRCRRELNNPETFYVKGMPDIELEQKFDIAGLYDYFNISRRFFGDLDDGLIAGFCPQIGDEIEPWSYDNNFCEILPNPNRVGGYVSVMHWSRTETHSWDAGIVTYKKKLFSEDSLARWERNYHDQPATDEPAAALRDFFALPLRVLPNWRRTRFDLAVEARATANVFMVNFEDSRIEGITDPSARLQQCEIEYLKTRGVPSETSIYSDLAALSAQVEHFMTRCGLVFQRSNYSKLTFLREYTQKLATAGEGA